MIRNIRVSYKYLYRNPVKRTVGLTILLKEIIQTRATFLQNWLDSDAIYDPTNDFKVTKLTLDNNKQITFVELTEMENNING